MVDGLMILVDEMNSNRFSPFGKRSLEFRGRGRRRG